MTLEEKYFTYTGTNVDFAAIKAEMAGKTDVEKTAIIDAVLWHIPGGCANAEELLDLRKAVYAELGPVSGDVTGDGVEDERDEERITILSSANIDLGSTEDEE